MSDLLSLSLDALVAMVQEIIGDDRESRDLISMMHDRSRHWTREEPLAEVSGADVGRALQAARLRRSGAPLQYAAKRAAFRHVTLHVDERVLIPRPETELLVDIVLKEVSGGVIVDVGTGSGAIAISLATEGRYERIIATDISKDALAVASANAARLGAEVDFRHGSLLNPVSERGVSAIVSNPPYISFDEADDLPAAVRDWEPSVALFSPGNGMETTARLVHDAAEVLAARGLLAMEVDMRRASAVAKLCEMQGAYEDVRTLLDLTGRERFVVAKRREELG